MRSMVAAGLVVLAAGCGTQSAREKVQEAARQMAFTKPVRSASCAERGGARPAVDVQLWSCTVAFRDGTEGRCLGLSGDGPPSIEGCQGAVVAPPSLAEVEREMRDSADGVQRAECRPDGERRWRCRLVFADQPDGEGSYESRPEGGAVVGVSTSRSSPAP